MKALKLSLGFAVLALVTSSCSSTSTSTSSDNSASKGYKSARLVSTTDTLQDGGPEGSTEVNNAIQRSIRNHFKTRGFLFGSPSADLIVSYMIVGQGTGMATMNQKKLGDRVDVNNLKPGTLVIDIVEAKTNKVVFRNHTEKDLVGGVKPTRRDAHIHVTVVNTLSPFFN